MGDSTVHFTAFLYLTTCLILALPRTSRGHTPALACYREMARNACEEFVGPMPVDEFVPEATRVRPENGIMSCFTK